MKEYPHIHLSLPRFFTGDEYYRVYFYEDTLVFVKLGGQFHHENLLEQAGLFGAILFYIPYKIARKRQEKREAYVDAVLVKKGMKALLKERKSFQLKQSEIKKMIFRTNWKTQIFSNYDKHLHILKKDGTSLKAGISYGQSKNYVLNKLTKKGYLVEEENE
ncbi:hypothetical protein X560_1989 [Listeria fleischmannii 1991]|uniref:Uncharacterized protein n=2 Tax=Listeria fleischmannii TaxID=1069827 RepID=A0A2X3J9Y8_9LIST|nr:hypothetical protein [Listeria fleischmannii]EMG27370.1 hypothetical protein LFLEISCH_11445 [Listeria fleischmannii subsp. fleischmannii LU2006-1]KMT58773.1 hypothetical protein X560_1989 [Listeria fleischmannii 1991]SQC71070.1 Uncharacterised protein [Listeria fleischmannii subsp. fleischmannii]